MLYSRRKKIDKEQAAAAAGRDLWTSDLPTEARMKFVYAVQDLVDGTASGRYTRWDLIEHARNAVLRDLGQPHLGITVHNSNDDFFGSIMKSNEEVVYSQLEAVLALGTILCADRTFGDVDYEVQQTIRRRLPELRETISQTLREYWIKCDLIGNQFIDVESRELHEAVVVPALGLLGGRSHFELAEKAYQEALREIHNGSAEDAITDAATALQEALGAVGFTGNTVSKRVEEAVKQGKLTPYDKKLGEWVEADRSYKGDAHNASPATVADAWLVVHIVGAVILRLAADDRR